MAEKKKAPAKKKAAPKKAPAPKVEAANPVGRPKNVVKLTETEVSHEMKNFISSLTSFGLTSDDVAVGSLWIAMKECQLVGPQVMASKIAAVCRSLNG